MKTHSKDNSGIILSTVENVFIITTVILLIFFSSVIFLGAIVSDFSADIINSDKLNSSHESFCNEGYIGDCTYAGFKALNENNLLSNVFFLIIQTVAVALIFQFSKYLSGKQRVINNVKNGIKMKASELNASLKITLDESERLRIIYAEKLDNTKVADIIQNDYPKFLDENGQEVTPKNIRVLISESRQHCAGLDTYCEGYKDYLYSIDIGHNLQRYSDIAEALDKSLQSASGQQYFVNMLNYLEGSKTLSKQLNDLKPHFS